VTWALLAFAVVILVTAQLNGGMGVRALGGSMFGGKKYFLLLFAIVGYFALSLQRIPEEKADLYAGFFVLSRSTLIASNLVVLVPTLWFFYYVLPTDYAMNQAMAEEEGFYNQTSGGRYAGVGIGLMACSSYMLMRFGVRGLLDGSRPWRFLLYLGIVALSLVGGFRSVLLAQALLFVVMFSLEGLWRTRTAVILVISSLLGLVLLALTANHLPIAVQRSLSILPIDIDPAARLDAQMSSDWRLKMWSQLYAEIPNYFWLGKGYVANATDYFLLVESTRRGMADTYELSLLAGDFHNGPLSVIIPFGIWGVLAFGAFLIAAGRLLRANYRFGRPGLNLINRFLLAAFWADLIFFVTVFGDLTIDFHRFAGYVALSIGLNGGMATNAADSRSDNQTPIRSKPGGGTDRYEKPIRPMRFRA
jgi:O-antigen ligase